MQKLSDQGKLKSTIRPSSNHQFIAFNLADPANPQSGVDKSGNPVKQTPHAIFGDVRVRQAFALSIDHDALNKGAYNGFGIATGTPVLPDTWAYDDGTKPWPYDPAQAAKLLDDAGFVKDPSNPDGPRIANDKALYAKPGTKLQFTLSSFKGNASVDAANVLMQDELKQTGFKMDIQTLDFQTLVQNLEGHKFDAATFFLGMDANDPAGTLIGQLDLPATVIGSGLNGGSWYNKDFIDALKQARNLQGCDLSARKKLMSKAQQIFHDDIPWYIVNYSTVMAIAQPDLQNWAPRRFSLAWNLDAWAAPAAQ
jgi:peptide/nickel transport system substrate-binding protein